MGIFDRFRHKAHHADEEARSSLGGSHEQDTTAMTDAAQRAALAHDEAADAFGAETEKAGRPGRPRTSPSGRPSSAPGRT
ncbi:hypothetical protein ACFQ0M_19100 [Kitasatospora aburaviensis]